LLSLLLFSILRGIGRAWVGEYTIRLPRRARPHRERRLTARRRGPKVHVVREGGKVPPEPAEPEAVEAAAPSPGPGTRAASSWWQRAMAAVTRWVHKPAPDGVPEAEPVDDAGPAGTAGPDRPDGGRDR
jgi:hypothetical protein